ncbi:MAG: winged helix-turn-helix domain-containing protein [Thermoanaerobaculia bacterium]
MRLRFGDFILDEGRRLLLRGTEKVHVSPRAYQLLALLVARRPEAVPRAALAEALWPGAGSGGVGLAPIVSELRQVLGTGPGGESWVRTIHTFGYAFDGEVHVLPTAQRHVLVRGLQRVDLAEGRNLLGRERKATVRLGHPSVAYQHARIVVADDQAQLEDLTGGASTFRGAEPVRGRVVLEDGDIIRVGAVVLTYRILAA